MEDIFSIRGVGAILMGPENPVFKHPLYNCGTLLLLFLFSIKYDSANDESLIPRTLPSFCEPPCP